MSQVKNYSGKASQTTDIQLEVVNIADNISVYRLTKTKTSSHEGIGRSQYIPSTSIEVQEGFVDSGNLKLLTLGSSFEELNLVVFTDTLLHNIHRLPYEQIWTDKRFKESSFSSGIRTDCFQAFLNKQVTLDNLVSGDFKDTKVYKNHKNEYIPMSIQFDYYNGNVDDTRYYLEVVLETLKERDDITFNLNSSNQHIHELGPYTSGKEAIKYLSFNWHPSDKDFAKLVAHCEIDVPSELYHGIRTLDLLNLEQDFLNNKLKW